MKVLIDSMEISLDPSFIERIEKLEKSDFCKSSLSDVFFGRLSHLENEVKKLTMIYSAKLTNEVCAAEVFERINLPSIKEAVKNLQERINKSDLVHSQLVEKIAEVANYYYRERKEPHKCPVCDGISHLHRSSDKENLSKNFEFYREYVICHACKGEGILWG